MGLALLIATITSTSVAPALQTSSTQLLATAVSLHSTLTPIPVADIAKNPFAFAPTGLVLLSNTRILYSDQSGSLYRIVSNQDPQFVLFAANDGFRAATEQNGSALLLSRTGSLFSYGGPQQPPIDLPLSYDPNSVIDIAFFRDSLYLLHNDGAIYKYTKDDANIYQETLWAQTNTTEPSSFTIDGSIYIADTNGTITEYLKGNHVQSFEIGINPTPFLALSTTNASPLLIAVAPAEKTVTIINKETLEKTTFRILHPAEIHATAVDVENNTLYLLSGTELLKLQFNE